MWLAWDKGTIRLWMAPAGAPGGWAPLQTPDSEMVTTPPAASQRSLCSPGNHTGILGCPGSPCRTVPGKVAGRGGHVCGVCSRGPQLSRCGSLHLPCVSGKVHITLKLFPDTVTALEDSPVFKTSVRAELTERGVDLVRGPGKHCQVQRASGPPWDQRTFSSPPFSVSLLVLGLNHEGREGRERRVRGSHREGKRWWSGQDRRDEGHVLGSPGRLQRPITNTH